MLREWALLTAISKAKAKPKVVMLFNLRNPRPKRGANH
jgi:hypothetical protein